MHVMTFVERPAEYRALLFDSLESAPTMAQFLREAKFNGVQFVDTFGHGFDQPYLEYEGHKVYVNQWVVLLPDGSSEVLWDQEFVKQYMPRTEDVLENFNLENNKVAVMRELYPGVDKVDAVSAYPDVETLGYDDRTIKPGGFVDQFNAFFQDEAVEGHPGYVKAGHIHGFTFFAKDNQLFLEREDRSLDPVIVRVQSLDLKDGDIVDSVKYTEETLGKARDVIRSTVGVPLEVVDILIDHLQNAGILFRERL
jgi:hypothetical protein